MHAYPSPLKNGTQIANIARLQSSPSSPASHTWGGARNFKQNASEHLSLEQCRRLIRAFNNSEKLGLPFNRHWTVHYEKAGVAEENATQFIGRLLKLVREYAGRHQKPFSCIWVREGGVKHGGHVHILMHLPPELSLRGRIRKWIRLAGGTSKQKVSRITAVGGRLTSSPDAAHYQQNVRVAFSYLLKCASEPAGQKLGLARSGVRARIAGKRCGYSQNLGRRTTLHEAGCFPFK